MVELSSLPIWLVIPLVIGVGVGAAIAVGWYLSRSLTGEKGVSISDLLSTLDDKLATLRTELETARREMIGEIRSLDSRVRQVEIGQARMQGTLDVKRQPGPPDNMPT